MNYFKGVGPYRYGASKTDCGCELQKPECDCDDSPAKLAPLVGLAVKAAAPVVAGKVMDKVL